MSKSLSVKPKTFAVALATSASGGFVTLQSIGSANEGLALIARWATAGFAFAAAVFLTGLVFTGCHRLFGEAAVAERARRNDPRLRALEAARTILARVLIESPRIDDVTYRQAMAELVAACGQAEVEGVLEAVRRGDKDEDLERRLRNMDTEFLRRVVLHGIDK